jgi:hypothetical protein
MNSVEVKAKMSLSYCHICEAEVDDFGGSCRLGHALLARPVKATPPPPPPERPTHTPPPPPPPPPIRQHPNNVWTVLEDGGFEGKDPIASFAPPHRMNWGPENEAPIIRNMRSLISRRNRRFNKLETQAAS